MTEEDFITGWLSGCLNEGVERINDDQLKESHFRSLVMPPNQPYFPLRYQRPMFLRKPLSAGESYFHSRRYLCCFKVVVTLKVNEACMLNMSCRHQFVSLPFLYLLLYGDFTGFIFAANSLLCLFSTIAIYIIINSSEQWRLV